MDPILIRFQERQVLIMLKCIIYIITSRETQEGKLFVRETRVLSFHFWKLCPLNLKHSGGSFRGQKHKQLWAGFMIHICGLKIFSYSCPGMESWACQGCTHFLPKQPVVTLIFRYRGRKDSRPRLQQPLELAWVGPGCPGAGQVRREELRPSSPLQGEVGLPLPAGAAVLSLLRAACRDGSCFLIPSEPTPDRQCGPWHRWSRKPRVPVVPWHAIKWPPKLSLSESSLILAPVWEASFFALGISNVNERVTGLLYICWFSIFALKECRFLERY